MIHWRTIARCVYSMGGVDPIRRRPDLVLTAGLAAVLLAPSTFAQQFVDQSAVRFPMPDPLEYSNACTIGDIDGDGDLDILIANGGDRTTPGTPQKLRIYVNNGVGIFTDESDARYGTGEPPIGQTFFARSVELGDVDRDGDLDIVIAQDFNNQPQLLINNGKGFFANETIARLPAATFCSSRAQFADVDNDNDLDLYLLNSGSVNRFGSGRGKLWLNDGNGVFTDVTISNTPNQNVSEPIDCIFADIDGDFDLDLRISSTSTSQSRIYRNNGLGVFMSISSPSDNNAYSYDFGDIDGDGDLDMLGANAHNANINSELLLRNTNLHSGSFTSVTFPLNLTDDRDSKFFDIDNDNDLDLIVASTSTTERIYTNNGSGTYALAGGVIQAVSDVTLDLKVADLDNNGRYDIVTVQGESGNFANRMYMNMTGPADTQSPRVVTTEQVASTNNADGPYVVRAMILDAHSSDRGFHDKGIHLNYTVAGFTTQQVEMEWVGNSMWRGELPGQAPGSQISYWVTAIDFAGNVGTGPQLAFEVFSPPCPADVNDTGTVNVDDLLGVINAWGESGITHHVAVSNFSFTPATFNARVGDTIQWNWVDGLHTVTSGTPCIYDNTYFDEPISSASQTFTWMIPPNVPDPFPYFCTPHCPGMAGNINITPFPQDINADGVVNVDDLLEVINAWGDCP